MRGYTSDTVFDTFPSPQFSAVRRDIFVEPSAKKRHSSVGATSSDDAAPDGAKSKPTTPNYKDSAPDGAAVAGALKQIRAVADTACALRALRRQIMDANGWSLRDLYRTLETPGDNKLRVAHAALDTAVRAAYGLKEKEDILAFLRP